MSLPIQEPTIRHATREGITTPSHFPLYQNKPQTPQLNLSVGHPDVPHILEMIHLLAEHEKASDSVQATPTTLLSTLSFPPFSSSTPGYARTLLIHPAGSGPTDAPAGMALYFPTYSTWRAAPGIWLEDLFVKREFRGRGYGTRLLGRLATEVAGMGGARLEWCVLKWNTPSVEFYQSAGIGAERMEEWVTMRVDDRSLLALAARDTAAQG